MPNVQQDANAVAAYVIAAGFPPADVVTMVEIAGAESTFQPRAVNGQHWGLFQIAAVHNPTELEKTDGAANAKVAYRLYTGRGGPASSHRFDDWNASRGSWSRWEKYAAAAAKMPAAAPTGGIEKTTAAVAAWDVPAAIKSAADSFTAQLGKMAGMGVAVAVALVLLIIGVVLLLGKPALAAAAITTPVGKAGKLIGAAKAVTE
jgi:hypothetical protein